MFQHWQWGWIQFVSLLKKICSSFVFAYFIIKSCEKSTSCTYTVYYSVATFKLDFCATSIIVITMAMDKRLQSREFNCFSESILKKNQIREKVSKLVCNRRGSSSSWDESVGNVRNRSDLTWPEPKMIKPDRIRSGSGRTWLNRYSKPPNSSGHVHFEPE